MSTWANVAKLVKTKNLEGGLVVESTTGLPLFFEIGTQVTFVPPTLEGPRTGTIKKIEGVAVRSTAVLFEEVTSIDCAQDLVGRYCLIDLEQYPSYQIQVPTADSDDLIGYEVFDSELGAIGSVKFLNEIGPQSLLVVARGEEEVLIPFVEEIVVSIDHNNRTLETRLPKGILEL